MTRHSLHALLVAGMVLLAGCAGGISGTPTDGGDAGPRSADTGTVNFYISDEPNAIEDFEHLNVTITGIGFQHAGGGDEVADEREGDDSEPSADENETGDDVETEYEREDAENETGDDVDVEDEREDAENETNARESGGWTEFDVDDRVVDLTELKGANATQIDQYDLPNGTYTTVFVHVSDVDGTLTTGEQVNVKLPSSKLQLEEDFTVGNGTTHEFVFDIGVHKAGKSGKYILKPTISESGTDVPIRDVDADDDERDDTDREDDERDDTDREDDEREDHGDDERTDDLNATFVGTVTPGENATVDVAVDGDPVADAAVFVDDERVGATDAEGRLTFGVPDGEELEVTITSGEAEAELEREFEAAPDSEATPTPTPTA